MSSRLSTSSSREKLHVTLENPVEGATSHQTIRVGCEDDEYLDIELRRTLRIPSNDAVRCAPAAFGTFPLYLNDDFASKLPPSVKAGGAFISIYQREAMWISFNCVRPFAVKVFVNGINIITGKPNIPTPKRAPATTQISAEQSLPESPLFQGPPPQDYVVPPKQLWLDGPVKRVGVAEQFVASLIHDQHAVEATAQNQISPVEIKFEITATKNKDMWIYVELVTDMAVPKVRLEVHRRENVRQLIDEMLSKMAIPLWKVQRISFDQDAVGPFDTLKSLGAKKGATIYVYLNQQCNPDDTGIGAGSTAGRPIPTSRRSPWKEFSGAQSGGVQQIIHQDFMPLSEWDTKDRKVFRVYLIRACDFKGVTGLDPPPTPVNAAAYAKYNIDFEEHYIEPGMVEEKIDENTEKENRPPRNDENVYKLPTFEDDSQPGDLFPDEVKNLRIRNIC